MPVDHSAVKAGWSFLSKLGNSKLDKSGKESSGILAELMKESHDRNLYVDWTSHRGGPQILTEAMGSTTVLLSNKPAARLGDSTAHGGKIVQGCPTVLIGG
ncbi:MAG: PAAR domain-containing protein [Thalassolituus sp.]